jgi:hypothetical protein
VAANEIVLKGNEENMRERIYFHSEDICVSGSAITVGRQAQPISELVEARCQRVRVRWLWPFPVYCHALIVVTLSGDEVVLTRRRNAYFIFQLVNAIQAALANTQQADALALNSSA